MILDIWQRMVQSEVARRIIHDAMVYNWNGHEQREICGYRHIRNIFDEFPDFPKIPSHIKLADPQVAVMLTWTVWESGVKEKPVIFKDDIVIYDDEEKFIMTYLKYYCCNETLEEYKRARPIPSLEEYRNRIRVKCI